MATASYLHSMNSGDLISSLAGIKHLWEETGRKAVIIQRLNMPADYQGYSHPVKSDADGATMVTMNKKQWDMLVPLLMSQKYVERCEVFEGQEVDINFDTCRQSAGMIPYGSIHRWNWYTIPSMACDLSKPWIDVPDNAGLQLLLEDSILINRTSRYRNHLISYFFLKKWEDRTVFAGTTDEYQRFKDENKLDISHLEIDNFFQLAQAIKGSKLLIGSQSMVWNIAESLKTLRIVEADRFGSNCVPNGPNGYDFLNQKSLEYYVSRFMDNG